MPVRLVIVDDHPVLLRGLASLLGSEQRFSVAATGMTSDEAVRLADGIRPDVMVLDLSMPGNIFKAIDTISERVPTLKLVVFTAYASVDLALRAFFAGARAFVVKGQPANELFDAIAAVQRGELFVSPEFAPRLLRGFRNQARRASEAAVEFGAQEQQLADALRNGQTAADIAGRLQCTQKVAGHYLEFLARRRRAVARPDFPPEVDADAARTKVPKG